MKAHLVKSQMLNDLKSEQVLRVFPRDAQRAVPVKGSGSKTFFIAFVVSAMNKRVL